MGEWRRIVSRVPVCSVACALVCAACSQEAPSEGRTARCQGVVEAAGVVPGQDEAVTVESVSRGAWRELMLPWGEGPGQAGFRPAVPEQLADGPSAVAVDREGRVLVLDRRNGRVLSIAGGGQVRTWMGVARDAELVAAADDGAVALWSPLRARVWIQGPDGAPAGEVSVPRELREIQGLGLGPSRRIAVRTSFQETFEIGSPTAPMGLDDVLRSKREGSASLPNGEALAARRRSEGGGEILVLGRDAKDSGRTRVERSLSVKGPLAAIRIAGVAAAATGAVICARVERFDAAPAKGEPLVVGREVVCLDGASGTTLLAEPIARPGSYVPAQDVAVGGIPPTLAVIEPTEAGLRVRTRRIGEEVMR